MCFSSLFESVGFGWKGSKSCLQSRRGEEKKNTETTRERRRRGREKKGGEKKGEEQS